MTAVDHVEPTDAAAPVAATKVAAPLTAQGVFQQSIVLQAAAASQGIQVRLLTPDEVPRALRINNKAREDVEIMVAKKHAHNRGEWYSMANDGSDAYGSINDDWETIFVRDSGGRRAAVHVPAASEVTVRALSTQVFVSESFKVMHDNGQSEDTIVVENKTPRPISVHVTPYMNVNDPNGEWYLVEPGTNSRWTRTDAQMVIVKHDETKRDAVLAEPGSKIEFVGPEPLVLMPTDEDTKIKVSNKTKETVEVQVTNYSGGSKKWYTLAPGASDTWARGSKRWEGVLVRAGDRVVGAYVQAGTHVAVLNVDRGLSVPKLETIEQQADPKSILFHNATDAPVSAFVSKLAGEKGDDAWFSVAPGETEQWSRVGPEVLAVRHADGPRVGVAVKLGAKVVLHQ
ncbi:hypothetical protein AMAG_09246 [Allomyces macrogynus ATCC 38327]|uniref:Uncharacterized protein n=1 Tax=Allomyces macrogynus (strain ATCC 38327) TaxID=578462 RepID=A0A0L0SNY1_ALLM3|nr:hypothetical protein AMAG_09246 [Allomyces macrogynus ATCC 38327]|eukprot:KNE64202.1 hypothetical protein AMAG_09246 [Allomyces macrogynus ATCC 38327]